MSVKTPFTQNIQDILAGEEGISSYPSSSPPGDGVSLAEVMRQIYDDIVDLGTLQETGGTLTADGTEQNVIIDDSPTGLFAPIRLLIDLSNMAAGDTTIIRLYYRIKSGGSYILDDEVTYNGPVDPALIQIGLDSNRFGFKVTLEQTTGTNRDYDWEYFVQS
ncbi:MAG: hypothetical protein DRZ76_03915 [Candidatus Nealsonbacteria bacterium]|nr:MAG: hypothetical protein DRZ76_03915 [Candidatus Nealsonbacteria bacterium]